MNNKEKYYLTKQAEALPLREQVQLKDFDMKGALDGVPFGALAGGVTGAGVGGLYGAFKKKKKDQSRLGAIVSSMGAGGGIGGLVGGAATGAAGGLLEPSDAAKLKYSAASALGKFREQIGIIGSDKYWNE